MLAGEISGETDLPQESVACFIDGFIADDVLVEAMLNEVDPFETGDIPSIQALLRLLGSCGAGEIIAEESFPDWALTAEQATCVLDTMAADPELIEAIVVADKGELDAEGVSATFRVLRDCGLTSALAEEFFGGLSLSEAQAECAVDEILSLEPAELEALEADQTGGRALELLLEIGQTCDITLADILGS